MADDADRCLVYVCNLLKLVAFEDLEDSEDIEIVREQMVEQWHQLTEKERKRMDELAENLKNPVQYIEKCKNKHLTKE